MVTTEVTDLETSPGDRARDACKVDLDAIFDRAPVGMAILDLNGCWLRVNQSLCDLLGYQREELMTLSFQTVTHPEDRQESAQHFQQVVSREISSSYQYEKRYVHKGGRTVSALLTVSRIESPDGKRCFIAGQIQDISKRREMEEALRSSEALFRTIGDNAGDLILLVDFPGLATRYASPTYKSVLGHSPTELRNVMEIMHPDDRELVSAGRSRR